MYLKIGVRSSTFKNHLSLISSHSKNSEASGQEEWKKFSKLSAKVDSFTFARSFEALKKNILQGHL